MLNSWQRIDRVLSGFPFGNGSDGAYSSATIPTLTKDSCSGTATSTTLTTAGSTFANGDVLLIHQTRGTGVGQWEINRVSSGGGTATLTLQVALNYTYTDSGASQAQATKIPMYSNVTVESGTWTVPAWDGNTGGILVFASNGTTTVTGTISGSGKGHVGGSANIVNNGSGYQGEGTGGSSALSTSANGNSGGGGQGNTGSGGQPAGAGGGNGAAGTSATVAVGGSAVGSSDLITLCLGGAGGGGATNSSGTDGERGGAGGSGGSAIFIFSKYITISGSIVANGNNGSNTGGIHSGGGGGGAGGSSLVVCQTASLGSSLITASAGAGGSGGAGGAAGGTGRIAVHHSATVTGTTSPTFTDVTDTTLIEANAGLLMNLL